MFCCLVQDPGPPPTAAVIEEIARACSPRVQTYGGLAVIFDAAGLDRAIGSPAEIGAAVAHLARERGVTARVALARSSVAAWVLAHACPGVTVGTGDPAAALAALPLGWLAVLPDPSPRALSAPGSAAPVVAILERWGIRTLGDLARLPRGDIHARTGPAGVRLHQAACGEDASPLVPMAETARVVERIALEWPVEGLEPLSFVLGRICDTLSRALERADRGAIAITTRLQLTTREAHVRTLHLPAPMREARVLRTLIVLDLEAHPPAAGIDAVEIELEVTAGRILQGSLLARALPSPEDLATLTARLQALMGDARVGAPRLLDTHDDRAAALGPFVVRGAGPGGPRPAAPDPSAGGAGPAPGLRRLRHPVPARVSLARGLPVRVQPSARGWPAGAVTGCAGPWRSSGRWWTADGTSWDRDEWDVEIAGGGCYRIARARGSGAWVIEALID